MENRNLNEMDVISHEHVNSEFLSTDFEKLALNCKIYKGDFYLDSFNYFPITNDNHSFLEIFGWKEKSEYDHFFTKKSHTILK